MFKVQTRKDKGKHQKNPEVAGCLSYAQEGIEVSSVTQPGKPEENGARLEGGGQITNWEIHIQQNCPSKVKEVKIFLKQARAQRRMGAGGCGGGGEP